MVPSRWVDVSWSNTWGNASRSSRAKRRRNAATRRAWLASPGVGDAIERAGDPLADHVPRKRRDVPGPRGSRQLVGGASWGTPDLRDDRGLDRAHRGGEPQADQVSPLL